MSRRSKKSSSTSGVPEARSQPVTFADFVKWERETRDTLDFKKMYVDLAGDLLGGMAFSELLYWYLPAKDGSSRLRVRKQGRMWIAVRRWEWWDRCRMTPRQADRALGILLKAGLIDKAIFKFDGEPTTHVALNEEAFLDAWSRRLDHPEVNPFLPEGRPDSPGRDAESRRREEGVTSKASPLTETTAENTAEAHLHSTADAEEGDAATAFEVNQDTDKIDLEILADAFADFAGLRPVPVKGEAKYADWLNGYKALLSICLQSNVVPPVLAVLCAMKRSELGFLAGRPGAYLKTAQNLAAALADDSQRRQILWQYTEYVRTQISVEQREAWSQWLD